MLLIPGVAPKNLPGQLHKYALWGGKYALDGDARIIDSVFARHQVVAYQRPINPGQHMVVLRVYLPKGPAEFAYFRHQARGQSRECDVALFQIDPLLSKGQEEVASSVGVNNGLDSKFRLMHLKRRSGIHRIVSGGADEVADHADVRVQCFGSAASCPAEGGFLRGRASGRHGCRRWHGTSLSLRSSRCRTCLGSRGRGWPSHRRWCRLLAFQLPDLSFHGDDPVLEITDFLHEGSVIGLIGPRRSSCGLLGIKRHG
ncbi:MAG: hypothetical protein DMG76_23430 [Acidobacteria bacterium]|nr:MAG: hypothetical protein DMG76_23430 [Acidobacteriota bacterium]